jgi:hypothetical protein
VNLFLQTGKYRWKSGRHSSADHVDAGESVRARAAYGNLASGTGEDARAYREQTFRQQKNERAIGSTVRGNYARAGTRRRSLHVHAERFSHLFGEAVNQADLGFSQCR